MTKSFLDTSLGYSINMLALLLKRELIEIFKTKGFDITPEQWALLARLSEQDEINQNDLATKTFKDNANITRIVDQLEKKEMLERRKHPNDRRSWLLFITNKGKRTVKELEKLAAEVLKKATKNVSKNELAQCNAVIHQIMKNLK